MEVTFKEVGREGISTIQTLAKKIWPDFFASILSKDQIGYMMNMMYSTTSLEKQFSQCHQYLLIQVSAKDIGYTSYQLTHKENTAKLHKIYIQASHRKMGVGRKTINYIRQIANENSIPYLELNVNRYNDSVLAYEKMGFQKIGIINIDIGNNYLMEDFIMRIRTS